MSLRSLLIALLLSVLIVSFSAALNQIRNNSTATAHVSPIAQHFIALEELRTLAMSDAIPSEAIKLRLLERSAALLAAIPNSDLPSATTQQLHAQLQMLQLSVENTQINNGTVVALQIQLDTLLQSWRDAVSIAHASRGLGLSSKTLWLLVSLLSATALVVFSVCYWLPLSAFQRAMTQTEKGKIQTLRLPQVHFGELKPLSMVINKLLHTLDDQVRSSTLLTQLNERFRTAHQASEVCDIALNFAVEQLQLPSIALLRYDGTTLSTLRQVGKVPLLDIDNPAIRGAITTQQLQSFTPTNGILSLCYGEDKLCLAVLYGVPLIAGEGCVGVLYVPSVNVLSENELKLLKEIAKDVSIALERSSYSEQQQQTEQALAQQLELTYHIINAIPNPTYYRDPHGKFMGVNRSFLAFLDQFEIEVVGSHLSEVFPTITANEFATRASDILQGGQSQRYEMRCQDGQGQARDLVVFEAPFADNEGQIHGIVGMFLDVTEHNKMQQELISAKEEADRLTKVKSEFLANMSHEIRTPMNAIIGMAHLALRSGLEQKQYDYVNKIDVAAKQLLALINDILDFSKIEAGKLDIEQAHFNLDKLLDNVATIIGIRAQERGLELIFDISPQINRDYIGDPLRLGQVLINLAGNAVKFTEQGEVTISIHELSKDNHSAKLRLAVKDTGIGMSEQQQKALFQSFSQADSSISRKYGGTGLGLTISQQLIKLMGGEIQVNSVPGQGSEFHFTISLPLAQEHGIKQTNYHFDKVIKALAVDDNLQALQVTQGMLESMGVDVFATDSTDEALKQIGTMQPDVVFVDWQMPKMDGLTFIQMARALPNCRSKFVLITAYGRDLLVKDNEKAIIDCIVLKPVNPSYLYDAVVSCVGGVVSTAAFDEAHKQDKSTLFAGISILVAEDQPINQEIAKEILSYYGAKVTLANNGKEAVEQVKQQSFNLVLMDMQMPEVDGITATRMIRKFASIDELPILAMTANAMSEDIAACLEAGMNGHIAKPIDLKQLEDSILQVIGSNLQPVPVELSEPLPTHVETVTQLTLEGINIEEGIERAAGNKHIYLQILEKFLSQQTEELINLQQAITIGNDELCRHILHAIKGASANLSMQFLANECKKLEDQLTSNSIDFAIIDNLIHYIQTQLSSLRQFLSHTTHTIVTNVDQDKLIKELEIALKDYNTDALDIAEQLVPHSQFGADDVEQLKLLIARFEFDKALKHLHAAELDVLKARH
ncbi:response regulator [Pseudoalteromonas fenneropenaei]|uniref:histidine kinase n=1 Tax=Pseudoalteromonas fenneropenaei TaxID=1737459 RepID=A0ABV7CPX9_9GAMM